MATYFRAITDEQAALIRNAHLFFVASADPSLGEGPEGVGPVNLSPKGGVPLHVLSPNKVAYLDYKGSGNETARHASAGGPMTVMVCSFEGENAAVVRLFGKATVSSLDDSPLAELLVAASADEEIGVKQRQVIEIDVDSTVTSCGYGVPVLDYVAQRTPEGRGLAYKPPRKGQPQGQARQTPTGSDTHERSRRTGGRGHRRPRRHGVRSRDPARRGGR